MNPFQNDNSKASKLKDFAHDNFKFDENGGKFCKSVGNTMKN